MTPSPEAPFAPPPGPFSTKARVARAGLRLLTRRSWRALLEAAQAPRAASEAKLRELLAAARDTAFGREHGFAEIRTIEEYQARVPIRGYAELEPWIDRMTGGERNVLVPEEPDWYAVSSGTTGRPKMIPVTRGSLGDFLSARMLYARSLSENLPELVHGIELSIPAPRVEGTMPSGVPYGSIAGRVERTKPEWARKREPFPASLFELADYDHKYYVLLRLALEQDISRIHTPNPSTVVLLCQKLSDLAERLADDLERGTVDVLDALPAPLRNDLASRVGTPRPDLARRLRAARERGRVRPKDVWPGFQAVLCWKGGSAPFYLAQFERWFDPGTPVFEMGFAATEGCFNLPLSATRIDGVLLATHHFAEFLPEDARDRGDLGAAVDASRLEEGGRYFLIVSNRAGLYRYDINDLIEVTGFFGRLPMIRFLHKGGNMVSITGEKLGESHVVEALERVQQRLGVAPRGFTVAPDLRADVPRYELYVEAPGATDPESLERLRAACDEALKEVNVEYAAKRASQRLAAPALVVLADGSYEAHRRERLGQGAADAQVKPLHLVRDPAVLAGYERVTSVEPAA